MRHRILVPVYVFFALVLGHLAVRAGDGALAGPKKLTGLGIEVCSCERICETAFAEAGRRGTCSFVFGLHIEAGQSGDVSLGGIDAAIVSPAPGPREGKPEAPPCLYVDRAANEAQGDAIRAMLNERFGARLGAPLGPPKRTNVRVARTSELLSISIAEVADLRARPVVTTGKRSMQLQYAGSTNAFAMVGRGTAGQVVDAGTGVRFDAENKSVLFGKFDSGAAPKARR